MKKLTIISLFIFCAVIVSILTAGFLLKAKNNRQNNISVVNNSQGIPSGTVLSSEVVAKHNSIQDCWMIINNKVYDLSGYFGNHPGGSSTISPYCGKDGTQAYDTKDLSNPRSHSSYADSLLKDYYIGDLGKTINNNTTNNVSPTVAKSPTPIIKPVVPTKPVISTVSTLSLTVQEVAKHSTAADCWMIIDGNVYNVTSYVSAHPGGTGSITAYCGKDGTQAFVGLPHSQNANNLLSGYFIGALNQSVQNPGPTNSPNPSITPSTITPTNPRRENDD